MTHKDTELKAITCKHITTWLGGLSFVAGVALLVALCLVQIPETFADQHKEFADQHKEKEHNKRSFLKVYLDNVENLTPPDDSFCPGDWEDLIYYMKSQKHPPDLFILSQISCITQATFLADYMSVELGANYYAIVALDDPWSQNSKCGPAKYYQTNAIIYRDRLTLKEQSTWQSYRWESEQKECVLNTQARTVNLLAQFTDEISGKLVAVESLHFPTGKKGGPKCIEQNFAQAVANVTDAAYAADLYIIGGDLNRRELETLDPSSDWYAWYAQANGEVPGNVYGFRDVIYEECKKEGEACKEGDAVCKQNSLVSIKECLLANFTFDSRDSGGTARRIDYMFAKLGNGEMPAVKEAHTVQFEEAGAAAVEYTGDDDPDLVYSDHKAVHARIHYRSSDEDEHEHEHEHEHEEFMRTLPVLQ